MSIDLKDFLQTIQPFKSRNTQPQIIQLNDFEGFAQIIQLFENDPCQNSPNFWENLGNPVAGILQIIEKNKLVSFVDVPKHEEEKSFM